MSLYRVRLHFIKDGATMTLLEDVQANNALEALDAVRLTHAALLKDVLISDIKSGEKGSAS